MYIIHIYIYIYIKYHIPTVFWTILDCPRARYCLHTGENEAQCQESLGPQWVNGVLQIFPSTDLQRWWLWANHSRDLKRLWCFKNLGVCGWPQCQVHTNPPWKEIERTARSLPVLQGLYQCIGYCTLAYIYLYDIIYFIYIYIYTKTNIFKNGYSKMDGFL